MRHLKRRTFIKLFATTVIIMQFGFLHSGLVSSVSFAQDLVGNPHAKIVEKWLSGLMLKTRGPRGTLHLSRFKEPMYFLTKPISWTPNEGQESFEEVLVPTGFVTDFASIPKNFWTLLPPDGEYTYAAIIHDYLYWAQPIPREEADKVFKMAMQDFGISAVEVDLIYGAVRFVGRFAWNANAKQKALGEKRILKQFPDDPRMQWVEWKMKPEVFLP